MIPPKAPVPKFPEWATYIPKRRPQHKYHEAVAHAKNALSQAHRFGIMYHWENDEWVEVERVDPDSFICVACEKFVGYNYRYYLTVPNFSVRGYGGNPRKTRDALAQGAVIICGRCGGYGTGHPVEHAKYVRDVAEYV